MHDSSYRHKTPDPERLGRFLNDDELSTTATPQQSLAGLLFREIPVESNGDCLFSCVVRAFGNSMSIEELRDAVARKQTNDTFQAYKQLQETEFPYMKSMSRSADFRGFIRKRGMYFGASHCYWGDENALGIIAENLRVQFAIYRKSSKRKITKKAYLRQVIGSSCCRTILLLHSGNHYTLIQWKNKKNKSNLWKTLLYYSNNRQQLPNMIRLSQRQHQC
jgi:hypothetical protein